MFAPADSKEMTLREGGLASGAGARVFQRVTTAFLQVGFMRQHDSVLRTYILGKELQSRRSQNTGGGEEAHGLVYGIFHVGRLEQSQLYPQELPRPSNSKVFFLIKQGYLGW